MPSYYPKMVWRKGQVAVLAAISMVPVLGAVAFVTDGGILLDQRRKVQATADAAALAAAYELFASYSQYGGLDPNNAARNAALDVANRAGYSVNKGCTVDVYIPPRSGLGVGKPGYVEVIIRAPSPQTFSAIFGSQNLTVAARSVARCRWSALQAGLLVLPPTGRARLNAIGNVNIEVRNAPVYVNSNDSRAGFATGNSSVTAPYFYFVGSPGYATTGSASFHGNIYSGQPPVPDPLAYLPPPDLASLPVRSNRALHLSGTGNITLLPGVYRGGITVSGRVNVTLMPGIYYLQGGGLQVTGEGDFVGQEILIYNDPRAAADDVIISGLGRVDISAPSSGPYQGIAIYQRRDAKNSISVTGNGQTNVRGSYYVANGTIRFIGNGMGDVLASQVICSQIVIGGNGQVFIDWIETNVARTRAIGLVE